MKFIETPLFTKEVQALLEGDEYKSLQIFYYCDLNRVLSSLAQVDFEKSAGLEKEWGNVVASG